MISTSTTVLGSTREYSNSKELNFSEPDEDEKQYSFSCCPAFCQKWYPAYRPSPTVIIHAPSSSPQIGCPSQPYCDARASPSPTDWTGDNNPRAHSNVAPDAQEAPINPTSQPSPEYARGDSPYGGLTDPYVGPNTPASPAAFPTSERGAAASPQAPAGRLGPGLGSRINQDMVSSARAHAHTITQTSRYKHTTTR
jgi:hypothetical protein